MGNRLTQETGEHQAMKVLIASQIYLPQREGGAERVARRTAEYLRGKGHRVEILAARDIKGPASEPDIDIPVHRVEYHNSMLPGIGPTNLPFAAKAVWHARNAVGGVQSNDIDKVLTAFRPDVIYLHNAYLFQPQLGKVARKHNIPLVLHVHDYSWMCANIGMVRHGENCESPCTKCRLLTAAWRKSANPFAVIAVSSFVRERYRKHGVFPDAQWHVLRNTTEPVDKEIPSSAKRRAFTFGFIGSIVPDKGIELLLDAFAGLPEGSAELVIAGKGKDDYVARLMKRTENLPVRWLGHVPKEEFYGQVDTVVVPSLWHEPQALVLVESIHRKRPIIASQRGGNTEVVTKTGSGLLFEPSEPGSLESCMREMQALLSEPERAGFSFLTEGILPDEENFGHSVENTLISAVDTRG